MFPTLQIVIGIFTAIIANQPFIKGNIFGVIFPLPYGASFHYNPLTFSNMFNDSIYAYQQSSYSLLKGIAFLEQHSSQKEISINQGCLMIYG